MRPLLSINQGTPLKRARDPQQKAARKDSILDAAAECFLNNGHKLPSAADVAKQAGIGKGTVYLYFRTKEEIFLALFSYQMRNFLNSLRSLSPELSIAEQLSEKIVCFNEIQPSFMPLAGMLHSVLETNLPVDVLHEFKAELSNLLESTGTVMDQHFKREAGFSEQALIHSYSMLLGLWQVLQWPKALESARDEPVFSPLRRRLQDELPTAFEKIWR
jgi:AcrR family transcriptional regulator